LPSLLPTRRRSRTFKPPITPLLPPHYRKQTAQPLQSSCSLAHVAVDSIVAALPLLRRREIPRPRRFKSVAHTLAAASPKVGAARNNKKKAAGSAQIEEREAESLKMEEEERKRRTELEKRERPRVN
jgi:hypothetical protein